MIEFETQMSEALFKWLGTKFEVRDSILKYAAREVYIPPAPGSDYGECKLDVVGYDKEKKIFRVVECKLHDSDAAICEAFGQVAWYRGALKRNVSGFLDSFTRRTPMRFTRLMEATSWGNRIRVEFYVALKDDACTKYARLHSLKNTHLDTGIFRLKSDLRIKQSIKRPDGTHDDQIAKAQPVSFGITSPLRSNDLTIAMPAPGANGKNELCTV